MNYFDKKERNLDELYVKSMFHVCEVIVLIFTIYVDKLLLTQFLIKNYFKGIIKALDYNLYFRTKDMNFKKSVLVTNQLQ